MEEMMYTKMVIERLFHFVWLHPAWSIFIAYCLFGKSSFIVRNK